jgi:two-component system, OmpR family, sensor histidine kinase TctE
MHFLKPQAWHRFSLRRTLLMVLIPGMLLVFGVELWLNWRSATQAADAAYDRSLLGAIKSIDSNISTASGGIGVELPYRMLEFFELTADGKVFFRVTTEDGLVEIGHTGLPAPPKNLVSGKPVFQNALYFDEPVRVGSYARALAQPLTGHEANERVVIQVAETLQARQAFRRVLVLESLRRDLMLALAGTVLLVLTVAWAVRPLVRLRNEVNAREADDLTPISTAHVPADARPLVEAINHHIERNHMQAQARRRFVDDASHQLRTPLTTLSTQVGFALREADPALQREALSSIKAQLDETVRQTNQMLSLAKADSGPIAAEAVDVVALAMNLTRQWWPQARDAGIDLGFEATEDRLVVSAQPTMLREALTNLLHNALRYTPRGGVVTVRVSADDAHVHLTVLDNGPGLPLEERNRLGERFFRGSQNTLPGTGLGLAIVRTVAEQHGGRLTVDTGLEGGGLALGLEMPR